MVRDYKWFLICLFTLADAAEDGRQQKTKLTAYDSRPLRLTQPKMTH